jgi:small-conductance mechanosensitive channel
MDKFQRGIVTITFAALIIYIFLSIVNVEKSSKWMKWYWKMDVEERRKYDPRISVYRLKKVLVIMLAVGISGFLLSWFIKPVISIITLGVIMAILIFSIGYIGPKNCLLVEKK